MPHHTNMSDGRSFTDYRPHNEMMSDVMQKTGTVDSKSLRYALQTNADAMITTNGNLQKECTVKEASGKSVQCGGPMAQYVSQPAKIVDFPKGPLPQQDNGGVQPYSSFQL